MSDRSTVEVIDRDTVRFKQRAVLLLAGCLGVFSVVFYALEPREQQLAASIVICCSCVGSVVLAHFEKLLLAARIFIGGCTLGILGVVVAYQTPTDFAFAALIGLMIAGAYLLGPRAPIVVGIAAAVSVFLSHITLFFGGPEWQAHWTEWYASLYPGEDLARASGRVILTYLIYDTGAALLLSVGSKRQQLHLATLRDEVQAKEHLFSTVPDTTRSIEAAAARIHGMTQRQSEGAVRQASAIDETRKTLHSLLGSLEQIVEASQRALGNAETTATNADIVVDHIRHLSRHTEGISSMLETMRVVARKSDLLAINASLEGTKAGQTGAGFSLIATRMQQLAERITGSALDIQELTGRIRKSTNATRLSMEMMTKLTTSTAQRAQEITTNVGDQQSSVAQVSDAMDDVGGITKQVAVGAQETNSSAQELLALAERLAAVASRFSTASVDR